jgi:Flp pilus assembly protein TadG
LVVLAPVVVLLLLFVVYCGRVAGARLRLDDAAHQAARAASLARSPAQAGAEARAAAEVALASAGLACRSLDVDADVGGLRPGSTATVTISCAVGLGDLALLGVPGTATLHASSGSPVDVHRATTAAPPAVTLATGR